MQLSHGGQLGAGDYNFLCHDWLFFYKLSADGSALFEYGGIFYKTTIYTDLNPQDLKP